MLQAFAVAPDLAPWVEGAVVVRLAAGQGPSRFPAMPQANRSAAISIETS